MQATITKSRLGSRVALDTVLPVFVKDQCYWPDRVKVDESFIGRLVVRNDGTAGEVSLAVEYLGQYYLMLLNDQQSIFLESGQGFEAIYEGSMRQFLDGIETFKESKTIKLTWYCGWIEGDTFYYTDSWTTSTYVEVPEEEAPPARIPTWVWVTGGVTLAAVGVIMVTRR